MKYSLKILTAFLLVTLSSINGFTQQGNFKVQLNKSIFKALDTIKIIANQPPKKGAVATLFLMAENEEGMVWEMRWPMLDGHSEASLILPDSLPQGQYRFHFSLLQNLFTVFGKVKTPEQVNKLNCTLLTAAGDLYESETDVNKEGRFIYKNVLFQDAATLLFTLPEDSDKENLNIEISTVLDSVVYPRKDKILDIYIGDTEPESGLKKMISVNDDPEANVQVLEAVTVYSKPTNRGEIFNKKYSGGLFKDMNERIINLLDNSFLLNSGSTLQLIQTQTPGIMISRGIRPAAFWRGEPISFYINEMRASMIEAEMIPLTDIAIIKVYPPPFFGNTGGAGGAIAIYTKRGGFTNDNYKNAFKVKGYTPLISIFSVRPDRY